MIENLWAIQNNMVGERIWIWCKQASEAEELFSFFFLLSAHSNQIGFWLANFQTKRKHRIAYDSGSDGDDACCIHEYARTRTWAFINYRLRSRILIRSRVHVRVWICIRSSKLLNRRQRHEQNSGIRNKHGRTDESVCICPSPVVVLRFFINIPGLASDVIHI